METDEIIDFMKDPLMDWFKSCFENPNMSISYLDILNRDLVFDVYSQIDTELSLENVLQPGKDLKVRIQNLDSLLECINQFYWNHKYAMLLKVPDTYSLIHDPEMNVKELKLLLLLLLGCAVICPENEYFIKRIQRLDASIEKRIAQYIKQVLDDYILKVDDINTRSQNIILKNIRKVSEINYKHLSKLNSDEKTEIDEKSGLVNPQLHEACQSQCLSKDLKNLKDKNRKLQQDMDENLIEYWEKINEYEKIETLVQTQKEELLMQAKTIRSLKDELDIANEKTEKFEFLESKVKRYEEKLNEFEYYKKQHQELLKERNNTQENYKELSKKCKALESGMSQYKSLINSMVNKGQDDKEKLRELISENKRLKEDLSEYKIKNYKLHDLNISLPKGIETPDEHDCIFESMLNDAHARAIKLQSENKALALSSNAYITDLQDHNKKLLDNLKVLYESWKKTCNVNEKVILSNKQLLIKSTEQIKNIERLKQEISKCNIKAVKWERDYMILKKEKEQLQASIKTFESEKEKAELDLRIKNVELKELELKLEVSNKSVIELKTQHELTEKNHDVKFGKLKSKCNGLEKQLRNVNKCNKTPSERSGTRTFVSSQKQTMR